MIEEIKGKINLIEDVVVKPNGVVPKHKHKFTDEIFYITGGGAFMSVDDKEVKVKPGDFIYVEKGEEHGFRNLYDEEFKMLVLKVNYKEGDSFLKQRGLED